MKAVQINTGEIFPLNWPNEILKSGHLSYFKGGEGYKKTKVFTVLEDELPERWTPLTWLDIAKLSDKYGLNIGTLYAECKTAGIVARQTANGYMITYQQIKHLLPEDFLPEFFDCLCADYMCACYGLYLFDIIATDKKLSALDPEYDHAICTYKGVTCSMQSYIQQKYGDVYVQIIDALIHEPEEQPKKKSRRPVVADAVQSELIFN